MLQVSGNSLSLSLHSANLHLWAPYWDARWRLRQQNDGIVEMQLSWSFDSHNCRGPFVDSINFSAHSPSSVISARERPVNYFWYDKPVTATDAKPHRCLTHNPRKCTQDRTTAYNLIRTLMLPKIFPVVFFILMCTAKRDTPATALQYRHSSRQHCAILLHG